MLDDGKFMGLHVRDGDRACEELVLCNGAIYIFVYTLYCRHVDVVHELELSPQTNLPLPSI